MPVTNPSALAAAAWPGATKWAKYKSPTHGNPVRCHVCILEIHHGGRTSATAPTRWRRTGGQLPELYACHEHALALKAIEAAERKTAGLLPVTRARPRVRKTTRGKM